MMVTNNEALVEKAKERIAKGYQPKDDEWTILGTARYATWLRTDCPIRNGW